MKAAVQKNYSITTLILLFFFFSFVGWLWEVGYHLVTDGILVNRGVLSGPWLPIYGTGSVLILVFLKRFFDRPAVLFFMIVALCGMVEYVTGWFLETFLHTRWWDYRDYIFQIQGRVCLAGLLVFGLGGLAVVYGIAPKMDQWIQRMGSSPRKILCIFLGILFVLDVLYSVQNPNTGPGITTPVQETDGIAENGG